MVRSSGSVVRQICPACRLSKCFSVGMRSPDSSKYANSNITTLQVGDKSSIMNENTLKELVQSSKVYIESMSELPLRVRECPSPKNDEDLGWLLFAGNTFVERITSFVRCLPGEGLFLCLRNVSVSWLYISGYQELSTGDRCSVFSRTMHQLLTAENYYHDSSILLNMSDKNFKMILAHFPEFKVSLQCTESLPETFIYLIHKYMTEEKWLMQTLYSSWQLDSVEFALLLALAFYSKCFSDLLAII